MLIRNEIASDVPATAPPPGPAMTSSKPRNTLDEPHGNVGLDITPEAGIEAKTKCLKAFGERIASPDPDRQTAEIHIRVALMNRFNALATAEIQRVA